MSKIVADNRIFKNMFLHNDDYLKKYPNALIGKVFSIKKVLDQHFLRPQKRPKLMI
jgi:hypothetical protein